MILEKRPLLIMAAPPWARDFWFWAFALPFLLFLLSVSRVVARRPSIFTKRFARRHRLTGLAYLIWLSVGFLDAACQMLAPAPLPASPPAIFFPRVLYDTALALLGTALTLSAAYDFKKAHAHVSNVASGVLEEDATVTFSEMLEHSFYQMLNGVQILFLHSLSFVQHPLLRGCLAMVATAPWLLRQRFPVNKFSDNYTKHNPGTLIAAMYRVKKYQYLVYKHFLLHGLNITLAVSYQPSLHLAQQALFRRYWILLNAAYVMEFFLQTLVKKGLLSQHGMLRLNQLLMLVSSLAALQVLAHVRVTTALLSLALNLLHRGHEVANTLLVMLATVLVHERAVFLPYVDGVL
jgi:hypothetical protein